MRKRFLHISTFLLTLTLVFVVGGFVLPNKTSHAQTAGVSQCFDVFGVPIASIRDAASCAPPNTWRETITAGQPVAPDNSDTPSWWMKEIIQPSIAWIVTMVLQLASLLTGLAALLLNGVIFYTVVNISENYSNIPAISVAWGIIRDVANMFFIFILLYAAIQTILGMGSDTKKLIIRVIVIAILINFSLFFTRVVIDASNVLAIAFYDAIAPGATNAPIFSPEARGLSTAFMEKLNLETLYKTSTSAQIDVGSVITIGVMGSIMLLIAAFVFFAAAIMFIVRFVVLILVLILSPVAFMAFVLPALKGAGEKWKNALLGQAFFAPIYFMLIWISLRILGDTMMSLGLTNDPNAALSGLTLQEGGLSGAKGAIDLFINFTVIIVFLIAALTIAKDWANKAGSAVAGVNKWAGKVAGGASFGLVGVAGRQSVGRAGNWVGESETLKKWARSDNAVGRIAGRLSLAAGRKTAGASFDGRGTAIGIPLEAGKAQKGGYTQYRKSRDEREDKFAASLEASAKAKAKSKAALETAEKKHAAATKEHEELVKSSGETSPEAQEARKKLTKTEETLAAVRKTHDEIHGNKKELDNKKEIAEKKKNDEISAIDAANISSLKDVEGKEKEVRDAISKLESEISVIASKENDAKLKELGEKKTALEAIRLASQDLKAKIKNQKDQVLENYKKQIADINATEKIEEGKVTRRNTYAKLAQSSTWAKIGGYNYSGAAKIRGGIKTNKDKIVEAVQALEKEGGAGGASTEKTEEKTENEDSNKTT